MTSSTDSLKKKVCVTVFLDELFEEVLEDNWSDFKQVSEVTDSEVKIAEKQYKGSSPVRLGNVEKVNVSPKADTERTQVRLRPRKHRRQSKFSENPYDSFKNELSEYEYRSHFKTDDELCDSVEYPVSDSDFDVEDFVETDKWTFKTSKTSLSELSEGDLSEECYSSINPDPSRKNEKRSKGLHRVPPLQSTVTMSSRPGEAKIEGEVKSKQMGEEGSFEKLGRNTGKDILSWKKTQREIQLVLANAKGKQAEKETPKKSQRYNLRSILEACMKAEQSAGQDSRLHNEEESQKVSIDTKESCPHFLEGSYANSFARSRRKSNIPSPEMSAVCFRGNLFNDCLDSDLSEVDSPKGLGLGPMSNDSVLCYTVCLRCKRNFSPQPGRMESTTFDATQSSMYSSSRESSFESLRPRASQNADLFFRTVTQLTNKTLLGTMLKSDQKQEDNETRKEGNLSGDSQKDSPPIDARSNNFAEGDAFSQDQKLHLELDEKQKLLCDEIFRHVEEPHIYNNITVNRAEIRMNPQDGDTAKAEDDLLDSTSSPERIAEFLFKQQCHENLERSMTDAESEMVFAESENSYENDDFLGGSTPSGVLDTPRNDVCVLEFEDKLSRSKILRRMKTVEILGDSSLTDVNTRISTEVFLVCENLSSKDVCLEAWHSSASTLKSLSEIRQCYLKDSKDSAMYLIEIPLHFVRKQTTSNSQQDSETE